MSTYDYLELALTRGAAARAAFIKRLGQAGLREGGAVAGLFTAQLGWDAAQVALLAERSGNWSDPLREIAKAPEVVSSVGYELTPTIRPRPSDALKPGGIYVHRWFEIDGSSFNEFVDLSAEAWPDFENRFDTQIFGLFEAAGAIAGVGPTSRHLLLITWYATHGVWEDSRNPTTAAMQTFARRAALTLSSRGSSTLLAWPRGDSDG